MSPLTSENNTVVDYVIIGAGLAGTVMHRFLDTDDVVVLDPHADRYKIGESTVPALFAHPELEALRSRIVDRPSWSPKCGTTFSCPGSVASFPLRTLDLPKSMHIAREDLDPVLRQAWNTPITAERVVGVECSTRTVHTDRGSWTARKQILDCSGSSMVIARLLDGVRSVWPVWSRWAYFDVEQVDAQRFWSDIEARNLAYVRYDDHFRQVIEGSADDHWRPQGSTFLTLRRPDVWTWQIPLFRGTMLSFGLVSREGPVSDAMLFDEAEKHCAPQYTLRRRTGESRSPYNRVHVRNHFANRAIVPATLDYVLVADACAFAGPVYSIGTGLAVNQAIRVAQQLNDGGWTKAKVAAFTKNYAEFVDCTISSTDAWYKGELLGNARMAAVVQGGYLEGHAFRAGVAAQYERMVEWADLDADALPERPAAPQDPKQPVPTPHRVWCERHKGRFEKIIARHGGLDLGGQWSIDEVKLLPSRSRGLVFVGRHPSGGQMQLALLPADEPGPCMARSDRFCCSMLMEPGDSVDEGQRRAVRAFCEQLGMRLVGNTVRDVVI